MSARKIILGVTAVVLAASGIAPALASTDGADQRKLCVALSNDPEKQDYAPLCIWFPGEDR
jgi:hypothetical protein